MLLSVESWALYTLNGVKRAKGHFGDTEWQRKVYARWDALKAYRCDPKGEVDFLGQKVSSIPPKEKPHEVIKYEFDPDRTSTTQHLGISSLFVDSRYAFALLTLPEQAGIPIRSGNVRFLEGVDYATLWVWPFAPLWAVSAYIRKAYDSKKLIDQWLTRVEVADTPQNVVDLVFCLLTTALEQAIGSLSIKSSQQGSFSEETVISLGEVLSRMTIRLSSPQLERLFDLTLAMYESPAFQKDFRLFDTVRKFLKRVFLALSSAEISKRLVKIVSLSFPGDGRSVVGEFGINNWPEPTSYIEWDLIDKELVDNENPEWASAVSKLIIDVEYGDFSVRSRAVERLRHLSDAELLAPDQRQSLSKALWSRTWEKLDIPRTKLYPHVFLSLPAPEPARTSNSLRSYILANNFPRLFSYEKPEASPVSFLMRDSEPYLYYSHNYVRGVQGSPNSDEGVLELEEV